MILYRTGVQDARAIFRRALFAVPVAALPVGKAVKGLSRLLRAPVRLRTGAHPAGGKRRC